MSLRIINGTVYDPANGVNGEVRDICIADGRVVASLAEPARTIDANGAGRHARRRGHPFARCRLERESRRAVLQGAMRIRQSGPISSTTNRWDGQVPAGRCPRRRYRYAGLGHDVFDAAVAPLTASCLTPSSTTPPSSMRASSCSWGTTTICSASSTRAKERLPETSGMAAGRGGRLCHQGGESRRHRAVEAGTRGRVELDTPVGSSRVTRVRFSKRWSAPPISCACRMPRTFTATISASRATYRRRSTACGRWTATGAFHPQVSQLRCRSRRSLVLGRARDRRVINAHPNITGDVGQVLFGPRRR